MLARCNLHLVFWLRRRHSLSYNVTFLLAVSSLMRCQAGKAAPCRFPSSRPTPLAAHLPNAVFTAALHDGCSAACRRDPEVLESRERMTEGPCSLSSSASRHASPQAHTPPQLEPRPQPYYSTAAAAAAGMPPPEAAPAGSRPQSLAVDDVLVLSPDAVQMFDEFFNFAWEVQRGMQLERLTAAERSTSSGGGFWRRIFGRSKAGGVAESPEDALLAELVRSAQQA